MKSVFNMRGFLLFVLVVTLVIPGSAKKKVLPGNWAEKPVVLDGQNSDWQDVALLKHKKMKVEYGFQNDGDYLYALFIFHDMQFMSSINSTGMTMWLSPKMKKNRKYGIKFQRRMITPDHFIAILERQHGPLPEAKKNEIKQKKSYTIYQNGVVNKGSDVPVPIKVASAQAPAFKVKNSPQAVVFEFKIPLKNLEGQVVGIGAEPGGDIMVGFEWGGMTKEMKARMRKKRGYSGSSAHGGVSTSMPGSGESGAIGSESDMTPSTAGRFRGLGGPKKYNIWAPINLAVKK